MASKKSSKENQDTVFFLAFFVGLIMLLAGGLLLKSAYQVNRNDRDDIDKGQQKSFSYSRQDAISKINKKRKNNGLEKLKNNTELNSAAKKVATHLRKRDFAPNSISNSKTQSIIDSTGYDSDGWASSYNSILVSDQKGSAKLDLVKSYTQESRKKGIVYTGEHEEFGLYFIEYDENGSDAIGIVIILANKLKRTTCRDVTSIDYNWYNDVLCTRPDGSTFYTNYEGARQYGF